MQSALECTICFENFDTKNMKPMMLPCNHGFCLKCLKDLHKQGKIECPMCKKFHTIAVKKIGINTQILANLVDLQKHSKNQTQDDICNKFAIEFLNNNIEQARAILTAYEWDYDVAQQSLNQQQNRLHIFQQDMPDIEGKGPVHKEQKIKELMKQCPAISEQDQAQFLLEDNEWHIKSVLEIFNQQSNAMSQIQQDNLNPKPQQDMKGFDDDFGFIMGQDPFVTSPQVAKPDQLVVAQSSLLNHGGPNAYPQFGQPQFQQWQQPVDNSKHRILLMNCEDANDSFYLEFDASNSFGMMLIEKLVQLKPLFGKGENAVYNIYRDKNRNQCVNYTMLSNSLTNLKVDAQPSAPGYSANCRVLYFGLDFEMKF